MDYSHIALLLLIVGGVLLVAEVFIPSGGLILAAAGVCLAVSVWCAWNAWWDIKGRMRFPIDDLNEVLEPDAALHPALIGPKTGEDAAVPKDAPEAVAKP